jgi:hypothetical protein
MLKQPIIEKLAAMRLLGMAEALKAQEQDPSAREHFRPWTNRCRQELRGLRLGAEGMSRRLHCALHSRPVVVPRPCRVRSTILTSQLPVSRWHEQVGDPTLADGILDRLVHNAHRIEMRGDSMRKNRGKPG